MEHDIKLTTDTPVWVKQYPLPYSMMQAVNDEVRSMIELSVIERSESPYCSLVIRKRTIQTVFALTSGY